MRYNTPPADLFVRNRKKFMAKMAPGTMAVFFSNDQLPDNADSAYNFTQNSNFYYLAGIDQEKCVLVLAPDAPKDEWKEVLFVIPTNEHIQIWEGWKYSIEEAQQASGIESVRYLDGFESFWRSLIARFDGLYLDFNEHGRNALYYPSSSHQFAHRMREELPGHKVHRAAPILAELRMHKEPEEIEQMRTACEITRDAFIRVCKYCKPGIREYELEAEMIHEFTRRGATGFAYNPIVAAGKNACTLHYNQNESVIGDSELILMDFGAEYGNYSADLTRTIPSNGKFTQRQKDIYNAVLRVQQKAIERLKPGTDFQTYNKAAADDMQEELLQLGLLTQKEVDEAPADQPAYRKYFMHGLSHHIGLDTHDVGDFFITMAPGMAFTVEPGIYVPDEGIGIRLENDIVITNDGHDDLMGDIPIEVEAIEDLMSK